MKSEEDKMIARFDGQMLDSLLVNKTEARLGTRAIRELLVHAEDCLQKLGFVAQGEKKILAGGVEAPYTKTWKVEKSVFTISVILHVGIRHTAGQAFPPLEPPAQDLLDSLKALGFDIRPTLKDGGVGDVDVILYCVGDKYTAWISIPRAK